MTRLLSDTLPKMEKLQIELLRQTPPWLKMEMFSELNAAAKMLAKIGLQPRYPQMPEEELQRRLAGLLLGKELACKEYGEIKVSRAD